MHIRNYIVFLVMILVFSGCQKTWEEYYLSDPGETLDKTVWELMNENPEYSIFVDYIIQYELDGFFKDDKSLTVFVPPNSAFEGFNPDTGNMEVLLKYHIIENVLNIYDIKANRLIETSNKKFAYIVRKNNNFFIDESYIAYVSPLCKDGLVYETESVLVPKPTLYEYISANSIIIKNYIDQFDSIVLDYNKSKPLRFDDEGNTIYDSVFTVLNTFKDEYFPLDEEFRRKRATMIVFDEEQYHTALNEMADILGGQFTDYNDIPLDWQYNNLLPYTIENGIFAGDLEYENFYQGRLKNIAGDSILVDYTQIDSSSRFLASNGVIFKYNNYSVPPKLYREEKRIQGEDLVTEVGVGVYGWKEGVKVTGSNISPVKGFIKNADNDSLISLNLGNNYNNSFMLEFTFPRLFPMRYRLEWRALNRPSGLYEIYVNDEKVGEFDLVDLRRVQYSVSGEVFIPEDGLNSIDFSVDNIVNFGDVKVAIKYIDSGFASSNGFSIDYFALIPY